MKPIEIVMQAFGPYRKKTTVDFSLLGENPIFLITGATGGGKTTILDAMCFALFCKATGGHRSWDSMRTSSAPDDLPTLVEFTFSLGQTQYRFFRSRSAYQKRGSGERAFREEHACYQKKGESWELLLSGSESKIRDYAQNLLNLTCEQFSQVMALPQGEFLKLLRASSKEKGDILQKLFSTAKWEQVTIAAKKLSDSLEKQAQELFSAKTAILQQEKVETLEELQELQKKLQQEFCSAEKESIQVRKELQQENDAFLQAKEIDRKFRLLEQAEKEKDKLQAGKAEISALCKEIETGKKMLQLLPYASAAKTAEQEARDKQLAFEQAEKNWDKAKQDCSQAEQEAKKLPELQMQLEKQTQRITQLQSAHAAAIRLGELQRQEKICQKRQEEQEKKEKEAEQARKTAEELYEKGQQYIQKMRENIQRLPVLMEQCQKLQKQIDDLTELSNLKKKYEALQKQFQQAYQAEQESQKQLQQVQLRLQQEEQRSQKNSAVLLASQLKEGVPCPVCGAVHHPLPASGLEQGGSVENLLRLRREKESQEKIYQNVYQKFAEQQAVFQQAQAEYAEKEKACAGILESPEKIAAHLQEALLEQKKAQMDSDKIKQAEQRLAQRLAEQKKAREDVEASRSQLQMTGQELAAIVSAKQELLKAHGDRIFTCEQVETEQRKAESQRKQYEKEITQRKEKSERCATAVAVAQTTHQAALLAWQAAQKAREQAVFRLKEEETAAGFSTSPDYQRLFSREEIAQKEETVHRFEEDFQAVEQKCRLYREELQGKEIPNLEKLQQSVEEKQQTADKLWQRVGSLQQQKSQIEQSVKRLESILEKEKETADRYSAAARLSLLLSGKNPRKIPLQQFVLGIMFDDVLSSCNQYFSRFSHGRYSLNRTLGNTGGNALSGLDLEALDAQHGEARSIETLSGGEQFLASLSLAFGLSEVVQSYSGSVRLDSIFIDEGFGSLDQETLDTAMKALGQIQRAGRMIGIISHVTELKRHIPARIEVFSGTAGSSVRVTAD